MLKHVTERVRGVLRKVASGTAVTEISVYHPLQRR